MMTSWGAQIISLEDLVKLRPKLGKLVITTGGFDPIHPGHVSLIIESKKYGDTLAVLVQSDYFLTVKKGGPFQNQEARCLIVSGIKNVDYVIPYEDRSSQGMEMGLEMLKPDVFTKGGDRAAAKYMPKAEVDACKKNGIEIVYGVGDDKKWSSSWFTEEWTKTFHKRAANKTKHKLKKKLSKYLED